MTPPAPPIASHELLPCPFCSGTPEFENTDEVARLRCTGCGTEGGLFFFSQAECESGLSDETEARAIAAWNQRAAPVVAPAESAALLHAQRVAPISDERIDAIIDECGMLDGPGSLRQARNLARALLSEAVQPSPAPQAEAAVPEGLRGRVITALECGALWAKGSEGGPRIEAVLAELLAAAPQQPAAPAPPIAELIAVHGVERVYQAAASILSAAGMAEQPKGAE